MNHLNSVCIFSAKFINWTLVMDTELWMLMGRMENSGSEF